MNNFCNLEPLAFKLAIKNTTDAIVLDVRTPKEVAEGTIENAIIIDYRLNDFTAKINTLDKERAYFVYCKSGNRSIKTCRLMENCGFKQVTNLTGGWVAWKATFLTPHQNIVKPMPRIGDKAPDFEAITTTGNIKFSEFNKDSWVILVSHPAAFTPVCATELGALAKEQPFFKAKNAKILGLSIDSIHAHLAWINNIREKTGIYINFPLVADFNMKIASVYGMIHPNESSTATVRAVFFIDQTSTIRLILYYPVNIGRNIAEIKRVLTALQTADANDCALPVNWEIGDQGMALPPNNLKEMDERITNETDEKIDFYMIKKDLPIS